MTPIEQIKHRADRLGLTQTDVAERYGTTQARISRWFGPEPPVSVDVLTGLAAAVDAELVLKLKPVRKTTRKRR